MLNADSSHTLWAEIDKEGATTFSPQLSGACCAFAVVKRGELLFSLILNYITEDIVIACKEYISIGNLNENADSIAVGDFRSWPNISFRRSQIQKSYIAYLRKQYKQNLEESNLLDSTFMPVSKEPGGPARILYLSSLNPKAPGFILSNGEKIGEWIGWLAFCRFCDDLVAYSVYPGTFFARDDILMTPSPPYSILEVEGKNFQLNYDKLRYLKNPSNYREMILVTHRRNGQIRDTIEGSDSRRLF